MDGKIIGVNAYLYDTATLTSVAYDAVTPPAQTPQYAATPAYLFKFSWTHTINV